MVARLRIIISRFHLKVVFRSHETVLGGLGLGIIHIAAVLIGSISDAIDVALELLGYHQDVRELFKKLVLLLLAEARFQVLVQHLHDLHDDVFLVLVDLGWLWLLPLTLLILVLLKLAFILFLLIVHLVLHEVVDRDQLEDLEVLLGVDDGWVIFLEPSVVILRIDERSEVLHGYVGLHGGIEVVDGQSAQVESMLLIILIIRFILPVHLIDRIVVSDEGSGAIPDNVEAECDD